MPARSASAVAAAAAAEALDQDFERVHGELAALREDLRTMNRTVAAMSDKVVAVQTASVENRAKFTVELERGRSRTTAMENRLIRWVVGTVITGLAALFGLLRAVEGQTPPPAAFGPAATCEGKAAGAECWKELSSHPGCYVWRDDQNGDTATWTGACNGSVADGEGVLTWLYEGDKPSWLVDRALLGEGVSAIEKGAFANGRRTGRWVTRLGDGGVLEVPWVNGKVHGTQLYRHPPNDLGIQSVTEWPFVNGKAHGTAVTRETWPDGEVFVSETRFVNGEKQPEEPKVDSAKNVIGDGSAAAGAAATSPQGLAGETASPLTGNAPMSGGTAPCEIPGLTDGTLDVQSLDMDTLGLSWCPASVGIQRRAFALQAEAIRCRLAADPPVPNPAEARETLKRTCESLRAVNARFGSAGGSCQCPAGFYQ